ncbi:hypothetical protein [Collimonas fungivorans]|uniref:hypothetical protein n=1 Tax=Collimonas fungivorans TaxID=158899 RepID=UPI0011D2753D|nr:hypothetical protein [Collimonas fungivorans]
MFSLGGDERTPPGCPISHLIKRIALRIGALFNIALNLFAVMAKPKERKHVSLPALLVSVQIVPPRAPILTAPAAAAGLRSRLDAAILNQQRFL